MKIGLVLSQTPGYSETFFRSKIAGLQKNGVEVTLLCQRNKDKFDLCPVFESPKVTDNPVMQAFYFLKEFTLLIPYLSKVCRFVKLERKQGTNGLGLLKKIYLNAHILKADLDWLHFGFATQALGRETIAKAIGAKMAVSFRGFDIAVYPVKYPGCYYTLWQYVDKIHTISDDLLNLAIKYGLPEHIPAIKTTPAIDIDLFSSNSDDKQSSERIVFMTTGRLHWKKGLTQTIEALAILKAKGWDFLYKIVGEGVEYEPIAFATYELGLSENIQFLGRIPHDTIKEELEAADIYLQYSVQEGFCNSVLEAQAMGKLCIVSNAEGLPENVLHEKTGWVVPKYSPELLAAQIEKVLLMDAEKKIRISKNAVERVRREFNVEKQEREFVEFYSF